MHYGRMNARRKNWVGEGASKQNSQNVNIKLKA